MDPLSPGVSPTQTPASSRQQPRSPPLAFQPTSNDSLAAPPLRPTLPRVDSSTEFAAIMASVRSPDAEFHRIIELQTNALDSQNTANTLVHNAMDLLQSAYAAERQAWAAEKQAWAEQKLLWAAERDQLLGRVGALEGLLHRDSRHSPARSPILSPENTNGITSPQSKASQQHPRLPSIAEDENLEPSSRRGSRPAFIDLPPRMSAPSLKRSITNERDENEALVSFEPDVQVEEIPAASPVHDTATSPLPVENRVMAGHTPLRAPRTTALLPTSMAYDGMNDTPTRRNTQVNDLLTQHHARDDDPALTGPLSLPELPSRPDQANFTLDALSRRLEQIESHPDDRESKPLVFSQPSPGLASPAEPVATIDAGLQAALGATELPLAPQTTRDQDTSLSHSTPAQLEALEQKVQASFAEGGMRLKKKVSTNFGAPWGQLGFGGNRRMS